MAPPSERPSHRVSVARHPTPQPRSIEIRSDFGRADYKGAILQDLDEAATLAEASGFYVASDRADGIIQHGFVVSPYPIGYVDANLLLKIGNMGPEWKDKVWVTRTSSNFYLEAIPDDAAVQTWGNVVCIGDFQALKRFRDKLRALETIR